MKLTDDWKTLTDAQKDALVRAHAAVKPKIRVGMRVVIDSLVERYPHFVAREGLTGVVDDIGPDGGSGLFIWVKMDEPLPGAEEWDNAIMVGGGGSYFYGCPEMDSTVEFWFHFAEVQS